MANANYSEKRLLGQGRYADIFLATKGEQTVALKKIFPRKTQTPVRREIECLQAISHPNVISLLDTFRKEGSTVLVFPLMSVNLLDLFQAHHPFPVSILETIASQLFEGLHALHEKGIVHRDMKPSNIMLCPEGVLKIIDLGQARSLQEATSAGARLTSGSHGIGTRFYKPLELLYGSQTYGTEVDIWAAGCILAEAVNGEVLFSGNSDILQLCYIQNTLGTPDVKEWPNIVKLPDYGKLLFPPNEGEGLDLNCGGVLDEVIRGCLHLTPARRLTAAQAKNLRWENNADLKVLIEREEEVDAMEECEPMPMQQIRTNPERIGEHTKM